MTGLTLDAAQTIVSAALKHARAANMKPLGVVVLDARGAMKAYAAEDKASLKRFEIAHGKAYGCLAVGQGSRSLNKMAVDRPHFVAALTHVVGGTLIPVPGGALIKNAAGDIIGAVGVSGDTSDNDEAAGVAGIKAAGLTADVGTG
ncbi:MAG: heme-binding protein [Xanthobacteraceae bacterium]